MVCSTPRISPFPGLWENLYSTNPPKNQRCWRGKSGGFFTEEAERAAARDPDFGEPACGILVRAEIDHLVPLIPAREKLRGLTAASLAEDSHRLSNQLAVVFHLDRLLETLDFFKPTLFCQFRDRILKLRGCRQRPRRIAEGKEAAETDLPEDFDRLLEVPIGLAGEADDDVRAQGDPRHHAGAAGDDIQVLLLR